MKTKTRYKYENLLIDQMSIKGWEAQRGRKGFPERFFTKQLTTTIVAMSMSGKALLHWSDLDFTA